jgi:hypothetical protein
MDRAWRVSFLGVLELHPAGVQRGSIECNTELQRRPTGVDLVTELAELYFDFHWVLIDEH